MTTISVKQVLSIGLSFLLAITAVPFEAGAQQPAQQGLAGGPGTTRASFPGGFAATAGPHRVNTRTRWWPRFDKSPAGARNYVVNGKMTGGFAIVAYPAEYGNSGVMTFIMNQDGVLLKRTWGRPPPILQRR